MEVHWKRLYTRCVWMLVQVFAMKYGDHLIGPVLADDRGSCDPSVTSSSSEIAVDIGDDLTLSCLYDINRTRDTVGWFRNNLQINDNERLMINDQRYMMTTSEEDSCALIGLTILDVRNNDEGVYSCRGPGRENGTISVRVNNRANDLMPPECSMNITSNDIANPSDYIAFTCRTGWNKFSTSLDWTGMERTQIKSDDGLTSTLVFNVSTALLSDLTCSLTCIDNDENCHSSAYNQDLTCTVPLLTLSSNYQVVQEGENVSFTCEINLRGYTVQWFTHGEFDLESIETQIVDLNDKRTSKYFIFNLKAQQSGTLICVVYPPDSSDALNLGLTASARFEVTQAQNASVRTDSNIERSFFATSKSGVISPTSQHKAVSVYIQRLYPTNPTTSRSSPLGHNLIIAIAVCGAISVIIFIAIVACAVHRRRDKTPAMDVNPVLAFGDISNDAPVNLDVHFNVYTHHQIYDESARSSDILHLDSTRRIPSVIDRQRNGYGKGNDVDRVSSFIPISEEQLGAGASHRNKDSDIPGQKLSFFVENDVYVSYDPDHSNV